MTNFESDFRIQIYSDLNSKIEFAWGNWTWELSFWHGKVLAVSHRITVFLTSYFSEAQNDSHESPDINNHKVS